MPMDVDDGHGQVQLQVGLLMIHFVSQVKLRVENVRYPVGISCSFVAWILKDWRWWIRSSRLLGMGWMEYKYVIKKWINYKLCRLCKLGKLGRCPSDWESHELLLHLTQGAVQVPVPQWLGHGQAFTMAVQGWILGMLHPPSTATSVRASVPWGSRMQIRVTIIRNISTVLLCSCTGAFKWVYRVQSMSISGSLLDTHPTIPLTPTHLHEFEFMMYCCNTMLIFLIFSSFFVSFQVRTDDLMIEESEVDYVSYSN